MKALFLLKSLPWIDLENINREIFPIKLKDFPIYIFDQSGQKIFKRNSAFIKKLNRQFKACLIHVSKDKTLDLADRLGIKPLIVTDPPNEFGYGGMRNCVFMLTPILKQAFLQDRDLDQILLLPNADLACLFNEHVLGMDGKAADTIFMIDDDMEIPEANIFAHLVFSNLSKNHYTAWDSIQFGRNTKKVAFQSLPDFLSVPEKQVVFAKWEKTGISAVMGEYVGKPKFCLNVPFGAEEGHANLPYELNFFQIASCHLSGGRFPYGEVPIHYFDGVAPILAAYLRYAFQLKMSTRLIDPLNRRERRILPWNAGNLRFSFRNMGEMFEYIAKDSTNKEIQKRFWKNVHDQYAFSDTMEKDDFSPFLKEIMEMDIQGIIKSFEKQENLDKLGKNSLRNIGNSYAQVQQDAKYLWEYGNCVINMIKDNLLTHGQSTESIQENWHVLCIELSLDMASILEKAETQIEDRFQIKDYPLTHGLKLLFQSVGAGGFHNIIKGIMQSSRDHLMDVK